MVQIANDVNETGGVKITIASIATTVEEKGNPMGMYIIMQLTIMLLCTVYKYYIYIYIFIYIYVVGF